MKNFIEVISIIAFTLGINSSAFATTDALNPLLGEIKWVGFNFAPRGWAKCDGQVIAISQNQALFSLLGTTYGGDGRTTFALPDVRSRVMMHAGAGPGLTFRRLGEKFGTEKAALDVNQMPNHSHSAMATSNIGNSNIPQNAVLATQRRSKYFSNQVLDKVMDGSVLDSAGDSQSHNNIAPSVNLTCIIATIGLFPSRN